MAANSITILTLTKATLDGHVKNRRMSSTENQMIQKTSMMKNGSVKFGESSSTIFVELS